jgi:hypothetical protein
LDLEQALGLAMTLEKHWKTIDFNKAIPKISGEMLYFNIDAGDREVHLGHVITEFLRDYLDETEENTSSPLFSIKVNNIIYLLDLRKKSKKMEITIILLD